MKYGGGVLYNLVFTEWRQCVSQKTYGMGLRPAGGGAYTSHYDV